MNRKTFEVEGTTSLSRYTPEEIEYRLKHYYKFLVVRHPFERLISLYNSKIKDSTEEGFRKYVSDANFLGITNKHCGVSFSDFVTYLEYKCAFRKGWPCFEPHWKVATEICHPCHIQYDYIAKFETFREDALNVLRELGENRSDIETLYPELFTQNERSSRIYGKEMSTLNSAQIRSMAKFYWEDFTFFDYNITR